MKAKGKRTSKSSDGTTANFRPLSADDLDGIVGGNITPPPGQFNSIAGFDTSHLNLDANSMLAGVSSQEIAQAVVNHQTSETQAMHLIEAVAAYDQTHVTQGLAAFAGAITQTSGHSNDGYVVGAEIGHLIAAGQVSATQAISDIAGAVTAGQSTGHVAVTMLAGMSGPVSASVQAAAGTEIAALVTAGSLTATQAVTDIVNANGAAGALTLDQVINVLNDAAVTPAMHSAVASEYNSLMAGGLTTGNHITADIGAAAAQSYSGISHDPTADMNMIMVAKTLTMDAVIAGDYGALAAFQPLLATMQNAVANGNESVLDNAVANSVLSLVNAGGLTLTTAVADLVQQINSHAISGDQGFALLNSLVNLAPNYSNLANNVGSPLSVDAVLNQLAPASAQTGSLSDVVAAVNSGRLAVGQAIAAFGGLAAGSTVAQITAGADIAGFIRSGYITTSAAIADIVSSNWSTTETFNFLLGMASSGNTAIAGAAIAEMPSVSSPSQATAAINSAIGLTALTPTQALGILVEFAGSTGTQAAVAGEIDSLISNHQLTASQVMTAIGGAVTSSTLTATEAVTLLADIAAPASTAVQTAVIAEIASLITAGDLTADQVVTALAGLVAGGGAAMQSFVATEISALVAANQITTVQAFADIAAAGASHVLNAGQTIALLASLASNSTPLQFTLGSDIATMIGSGAITASAAVTDIAGLNLSASEAFNILLGLATNGDTTTVSAAAAGMASLLSPTQLVSDIDAAIATFTITTAQGVGLLIRLASSANMISAVAGEIDALIASNQVSTSTAMASIGSAVTSSALTAAQAVTLLAYVAAPASTPVQTAVTAEIAALVTGTTITANQAVNALTALFPGGTTAMKAFVVAEINALVGANQITAVQAVSDIAAAVTAHVLTADQAVSLLNMLSSAGSTAMQAAAGAEIAALIGSASISTTNAVAAITRSTNTSSVASIELAIVQLMNVAASGNASVRAEINADIAALISATFPADTAVTFLASLAASNNAALDNAVAGTILSLVGGGALSITSAIADVTQAVSTQAISTDQAAALLASMLGAVGTNATNQAAIITALGQLVSGSFTLSAVMADIVTAVGGGQLTAAQAISAFISLIAGGSINAQVAAGTEIAALIQTGAITASAAITAIGGLASAETFNILIGMAVSGNAATTSAAVADISTLVSPGQARLDIIAVLNASAITAPQALPILVELSVIPSSPGEGFSWQTMMSQEISTLLSAGQVSATQITAAVDGAVTASAITAAAAVNLLTNLGSLGSTSTQTAVSAEIVALVTGGKITAVQAIAGLTSVFTGSGGSEGGSVASFTTNFVSHTIGALVAAGQVSNTAAINDIVGLISSRFTPATAVIVLAGFASNNSLTLDNAVAAAIVSLLNAQTFNMQQAAHSVTTAVSNGAITADQGITLLAAMLGITGNVNPNSPLGPTGIYQALAALVPSQIAATAAVADIVTAVGNGQLTAVEAINAFAYVASSIAAQLAAGQDIAALIQSGAITASAAIAQVGGLAPGTINSNESFYILAGIALNGSSATASAAAVVMAGLGVPGQATQYITTAVNSAAMTVPQAVSVLLELAAVTGMQAAVGAELGTFISNNQITTALLMTDIGNAVASSVLTATQAVDVLADLAAPASLAVQNAAATEITALVSGGYISGNQATTALIGLLTGGTAAMQAFALTAINALIAANQVAATQVVADVAAAGTAGTLTADQTISLLAYLAESGSATVLATVGADIAAMVTAGTVTATQAVADIFGTTDTITPASILPAIPVMMFSAASGNASLQSAVIAQLSSLVAPITQPQMATALGALAAYNNPALNALVANTIWSMVSGGQFVSFNVALSAAVNNNAALNVTQQAALLLVLAAEVPSGANSTVYLNTIGSVFATLTAAHGLPLTQVTADITAAVNSHQLTGAQAVQLLVGAGSISIGAQILVGGQIDALIQAGSVSASDAAALVAAVGAASGAANASFGVLIGMLVNGNSANIGVVAQEMLSLTQIQFAASAFNDINTAIYAGAITGDQGLAVLAAFAAAGNASTQSSVGAEIAALIGNNTITFTGAIADINAAVASMVLSGAQAANILLGLASQSSVTTQVAIGAEFAALVSSGALTANAATAEIAAAVPSIVTANQSFNIQIGMASSGDPALQTTLTPAQVMTSINGALGASSITVTQALALLAQLASGGNSTMQSAVAGEINLLVGNATITAATADQAFAVLAQLAHVGNSSIQSAVIGDINLMIADSVITMSQAMTDIATAVHGGSLTGDQAVALLAGIAAQGSLSVQFAAGGSIVGLIAAGALAATSAATDIGNAVAASGLTSDQAVAILLGMSVGTNAAAASAAAHELEILATPAQLITDINNAVTASQITATQALSVLATLAATGSTAMQTAAVSEINTLIGGLTVTQAMTELLAIAANGPTVQGAVANEINTLISGNLLTAAQAAADIGAAVPSVLTADQAVTLLVNLATSAPTAVQTAVGAEISTLISGGHITADRAVVDLVGVAATGSAALQAAAVAEINAMIAAGQITATRAISDFGAAVSAGGLTADQAITLIAYLVAPASEAMLQQAGAVIAAFVNSGLTTAAQAVSDVTSTMSQGVTAAQAIAVLINAAAGGNAGLYSAALAEIGTLARQPDDAVWDLLPQIAFLHQAGLNQTQLTQALNQIAQQIGQLISVNNPSVSATVAYADLHLAINAGVISVGDYVAIASYLDANYGSVWDPVLTAGIATPTQGADAVATLASLLPGANSAVVTAITNAVLLIVNNHQVTFQSAVTNIVAHPSDQAVMALTAMAAGGQFGPTAFGQPATIGGVTTGGIWSIIQSGHVSAANAMSDIVASMVAGLISADQAAYVMIYVARQADASTQVAVGAGLAALIGQASQVLSDLENGTVQTFAELTPDQVVTVFSGAISAPGTSATVQASLATEIADLTPFTLSGSQVVTDIGNLVAGGALTAAQAAIVLYQLGANINGATNGQIASLQTALNGALSSLGPTAAGGIATLISEHIITADYGVVLMLSLVGNGTGSNGLVASEIATLVHNNATSAAQVMTDIMAAVSSGSATVDQAVTLLAVLSVQGNAALQSAADAEILSLITGNQIAAAQAMTDVGNTIAAGTLTGDQAVVLLASLAGSGNAVVQAAIGSEIASLIGAGKLTASQVNTDLAAAITTNALSVDQAVVVLGSEALAGSAAVRTAAIGELSALVSGNQIAAAQVGADIGSAIGTGFTADQAVALLASIAAQGNAALQGAAATEILALIAGHQVTAAQAMTDIGNAITAGTLTGDQAIGVFALLANSGTAAEQAVIGAELAMLIAAATITATQATAGINTAITTNALTADHAIAVLANLAAASSATVAGVVMTEIAVLVGANRISAAAVATDIVGTIGASLTVDQAVALLAGVGGQSGAALQSAAIGSILALVQNSQINITQALTDTGGTVAAGTLTGDQAVSLLAALANAGSAAQQLAVGTEIAALIAANRITASRAMTDLDTAIGTGALTADRGVVVLAGVWLAGCTGVPATAVSEILALVTENRLSAAQAAADIGSMVGGVLTANQDVTLLASLWLQGGTTVRGAVAQELVTLITNGNVTAAQFGAAITAGALAADQVIALMAVVASDGATRIQTAIGAGIAALIAGNQITVTAAISDINTAISNGVLTPDQGVTVLSGMSANGSTAVQTAVADEIEALTGPVISASQAVADIANAVGNGISIDQAVAMLAVLWTENDATLQGAVVSEILALITGGQITAAQAMTDIGNTLATGTLTNAQVMALFSALSGAGSSTVQTAVATEVANLQGVAGIDAQVTSHGITAAAAIPALLNLLAGDPSQQSAVTTELLKLAGETPSVIPSIASDIGAAIGQNFSADQAVNLLISVGAQGNAALQASCGAEIASLITGNQASIAQVMSDMLTAVDSQWAAGLDPLARTGADIRTISADQAIALLTVISSHSGAAVQVAAGDTIFVFTQLNWISATQAVGDITAAVTSGALGAGPAVVMLAAGAEFAANILQSGYYTIFSSSIPANYVAPTQSVFLSGITTLIANNALSAAAAMADVATIAGVPTLGFVDQATQYWIYRGFTTTQYQGPGYLYTYTIDSVGVNTTTAPANANHVLSLLVGLAEIGTTAVQSAAGTEISTLIGQNQITATQAATAIGGAIGNGMTADQVMAMLAGIAATGSSTATAVGNEILALVTAGKITTTQAMTDIDHAVANSAMPAGAGLAVLNAVAAGGNDSEQIAVIGEVGALLVESKITFSQALSLLATVAGEGSTAVQSAAVSEIATLIAGHQLTVAQAVNGIGNAAGAGLSGTQAVNLLLSLAVQDTAAQSAVTGEFLVLLNANQTTPGEVANTIVNSVLAGTIVPTQALTMLIGLVEGGDIALALAVGAAMNRWTGNNSLAAITSAVNTHAMSANQAVAMLVAMEGGGSAAVTNGLVATSVITAQQAATALLLVWTQNDPSQHLQAIVSVELTALMAGIGSGALISPAALMADITAAVTSNTLSSSQAVILLGALLWQAPSASLPAIITEVGSLANQFGAAQIISQIQATLTSNQALAVFSNLEVYPWRLNADVAKYMSQLLCGVATGSAANTMLAGAALASMIVQQQLSVYTFNITPLVTSGALTQAQGVNVLAATIANLPPSATEASGIAGRPGVNAISNLANYIASLAGVAAIGEIDAFVGASSASMTACGALAGAFADLLTRLNSQGQPLATVAQIVTQVHNDVSSNVLGADQAIWLLSSLASHVTSPLIGAEIATLVTSGRVSAAQAIGDLDAAVTGNLLSASQAIAILGGIAANAHGNATLLTGVANEVASLEGAIIGTTQFQAAITYTAGEFVALASGQKTAAQVISDLEAYTPASVPADVLLSVALIESQGAGLTTAANALATEIYSRINSDAAESGLAQLVSGGIVSLATAQQIITEALTAAWPNIPTPVLNLSSVPSSGPYSASVTGGITAPMTLQQALVPAMDLLNQDLIAYTDASAVIAGTMTAATAIANVEAYSGAFPYVVDVALMHLSTLVNAGVGPAPNLTLLQQLGGYTPADLQAVQNAYNALTAANAAILVALGHRIGTGTTETGLVGAITSGYLPYTQAMALLNNELTAALVKASSSENSTLHSVAYAWVDIVAHNIANGTAGGTEAIPSGSGVHTVTVPGILSIHNAALAVQSQIESGGLATIQSLLTGVATINAVERNAANHSVETDLGVHLSQMWTVLILPANASITDVAEAAHTATAWYQAAWTAAWTNFPLARIIGGEIAGNPTSAQGYMDLLSNLLVAGLPVGQGPLLNALGLGKNVQSMQSALINQIFGTTGEIVDPEDMANGFGDVLKDAWEKISFGYGKGLTGSGAGEAGEFEVALDSGTLVEFSPAMTFTMVQLASNGMVALMTMNTVASALSSNPVLANISGPLVGALKLVANSCNLVTNLLNTTALTYINQVYSIGADIVSIFGDGSNTQKIASDGAALGQALFQYSVGFQFPAVQNLAQDVGAAFQDLFTGHPLSLASDVLSLGGDAIQLILSNPYLQAAATVLNTYATQVEDDLGLNKVADAFISLGDWLSQASALPPNTTVQPLGLNSATFYHSLQSLFSW
ncbi:hypothetical protein [Bradyrhizobium sacchari]|uniref:Uncharacterized protein n=4 Tax=Bradyrhizobium sacchari TaxID=1399419 RepID=A0A560IIE1_9BRAD|nr:hypothetical protein [Bradyrhizobium sacchari]TWB58813.1 hypothetical protein FBZ94_10589 [Bradyrhizobium sacchari]TWB72827.1 hypothetical protein FBZ95_106542 [Bradyrhizobium sacchari]